ncbi:DedA family protein [Geminisphaera colitermitum]|uniref:DedA family protein n=1 Tax=Geminisphaera colitermitum TaxID=1148786 RepID=UPI0001964EDF|nr:DedA family protein [Geminisphaera colitermitum]
MFEALLEFFQNTSLSLWGPFIVLLLCGLGLPLPEDVVLITAGVLAEMDGRTVMFTTLLMYVGVVGGDSMIFLAGKYLGARLLSARWFRRMFSPRKLARVSKLFARYGSWVLFIGRFLPGLRMPIFFTAGSVRVSFLKFLALDGLAALISVPVFVWLGHFLWAKFKGDIEAMHHALARTQSYSLWATIGIALVVLLAFFVWFRMRRQKRSLAPAGRRRGTRASGIIT